MDDELPAMGCGGFNPYNSAVTNAKWFFAIAARNSERERRLKAFLAQVMKSPAEFASMIYSAMDRAIRR